MVSWWTVSGYAYHECSIINPILQRRIPPSNNSPFPVRDTWNAGSFQSSAQKRRREDKDWAQMETHRCPWRCWPSMTHAHCQAYCAPLTPPFRCSPNSTVRHRRPRQISVSSTLRSKSFHRFSNLRCRALTPSYLFLHHSISSVCRIIWGSYPTLAWQSCPSKYRVHRLHIRLIFIPTCNI